MKEVNGKNTKPVQHDLRLFRALQPTGGWNTFQIRNNVATFRCMYCGILLGIAPRDMQGEFEHKCPVCGHVHVFNRNVGRWGTPHNLQFNNRMLLGHSPGTIPNPLKDLEEIMRKLNINTGLGPGVNKEDRITAFKRKLNIT